MEYQTKEYSFCLRCGRKLKNPKFRQRGYGDVCWKKVNGKKVKTLFNKILQKRENVV